MPTPAKVLVGLLALNIALNLAEFALPASDPSYARLVVQVLLLIGFLRGSEGVRTILQLGAVVSVGLGCLVLAAALDLLTADVTGAVLGFFLALQIASGLYMLWALRHPNVQTWMLNRTLGGALDGA